LDFGYIIIRVMAAIPSLYERNQEATVYAGNIDVKVNEGILWELFTQCGPVVNVHIPRDKITNEHQGYGFVEFKSEEDADYSIKIMHMIKLFGKPLKVNKASQDKRTQDVGANVFVGNLDPEVDEKLLYETFSNFGMVISTKITRDPDTGESNGHGFVSYDNFNSSDVAVAQMNGQYFSGRQIRVEYAIKKDTKAEKHGGFAERLLAENKPSGISKMPTLSFSAPIVAEKAFKQPIMQMPDIPLAKGGIAPQSLPPKPSLVKMP
jgi:splicing factor 3B subunit 4